ncbi:hypothetical protein P8452_11891 [Trifolium repens]|nr:hypothetical protein P8452_11891 [Trifolium repens]
MRRRNCNLELSLFPIYNSTNHPMVKEEEEDSEENQQHAPLTIFYDGKMCVTTDVTEFQAKSILMLANKKVQEKVKTPTGSVPTTPTIVQSPHNQLYSPGPGLSMKRSLQRFLQKRKDRIQEASPYNH